MKIDVPEIIEIPDYTDTDRHISLKKKTLAQAKKGVPFDMADLPSAEYKYYSAMWHIFRKLLAKQIDKEQARELNDAAYKEFADEQTLYNSRLFELMEFNDRIKKSEAARVAMSKADSMDAFTAAAVECIIALTNDKTLAAQYERLKGDA